MHKSNRGKWSACLLVALIYNAERDKAGDEAKDWRVKYSQREHK